MVDFELFLLEGLKRGEGKLKYDILNDSFSNICRILKVQTKAFQRLLPDSNIPSMKQQKVKEQLVGDMLY